MAEKYQESPNESYNSGEIQNLDKRINLIQRSFKIVVVDGNQSSYDQFHLALEAYEKINQLLKAQDSANNHKEIDRQLLICRIDLDRVDVFLMSQSERMNALQEEENRARAEGRTLRSFIVDLGKYKKVVDVSYSKPRGYYASGGVERTPHMKVKFPSPWYKEKKQAAEKFMTLLDKEAIAFNGFKSLEGGDQFEKVIFAIEDISKMKSPSHKTFLKIAAKYDYETVYGAEGALNLILGFQRAFSHVVDSGFVYLCSADSSKKKNKVEIFLQQPEPEFEAPKPEVKPKVQPSLDGDESDGI